MKICYITTNICVMNGLARVTIAKANALADIEGNKVAIIVRFQRGKTLRPLDKRVKLIQLDLFYPEDNMEAFGNTDHIIPYKEMKQRLKDFELRLGTVLGKLKPDIVVSTGTDETSLVGNMDMPWRPMKIREFHLASDWRLQMKPTMGWFKRLAINFLQRRNYRVTFEQYDRFVVLTDSDRHDFWHDDPRVVTIPNPLTLDTDPVPSTLENKIVVTSGRICRQKNFGLMARAWAIVARKHPDWQLRLYGDGQKKEEEKLKKQIEEYGIRNSFLLMGRTSNMIAALSEASVFALSSIYEGFGLVITEAMACGVPVVSTNCHYGPSDIISNGKDGFVVPLNDADALADRICRLIEDASLRRSMGKQALIASKRYNMEEIVRQWMNLFTLNIER